MNIKNSLLFICITSSFHITFTSDSAMEKHTGKYCFSPKKISLHESSEQREQHIQKEIDAFKAKIDKHKKYSYQPILYGITTREKPSNSTSMQS